MKEQTNKKKILIVEDEDDLLQLLKYNLEKQNYLVLSEKDGAGGLGSLKKNKPDLVLLDLMLPDMDGFEFCKRTRQDFNTPILILTASKNEICRKASLKLGANGFMTKPFSVEAVMDRIQDIISKSKNSSHA